ncbi:MAG: glycosyltransferase family 4 protein [Actinomycetota bacterium]|nr:glycosyltransferase family 4 protein [Actinomycetota bacterium]
MRTLMRRYYPAAAEVWVPCVADAEAVRDLVPSANVLVVPNVVDMGAVPLAPTVRGAKNALFVGNLTLPPNEYAVRELGETIMPLMRGAIPDLQLQIVGRGLETGLPGSPGVVHVGEVDSLTPYYFGARVAIVPVRAGVGPKLKVIEALARGVPVVATPKAISSITLRPGRDVLVGESASDLADLAIQVLTNDGLADSLAAAGRAAVEAACGLGALEAAIDQSSIL